MKTTLSLEEVMEQHPLLNHAGYGCGRGDKRGAAEVAMDRSRLLLATDEFERAVEWIAANLEPTKNIDHDGPSSYGMKHIAEPECGYIANGPWIAAMLACGYRAGPSGHPFFNPSFDARLTAAARRRQSERRNGGTRAPALTVGGQP